MKYFLDFDRTIFDTDAFKKAVERRPTLRKLGRQLQGAAKEFLNPPEGHTRTRILLRTLGNFASFGHFSFNPNDLRQFVYPDVPEFLATRDCTIVTYGVRAFVSLKILAALVGFPAETIFYTSRAKGPLIRRLSTEVEEPCVFVDDMLFQLRSVSAMCPDVEVIEMRRDGATGSGHWRVIHSLAELAK